MADANKTEKPTGKRLEKARKDGQFPASKELITAGQFIAFVGITGAYFPGWLAGMKAMFRDSLEAAFHGELDVTSLHGIASAMIQHTFVPLSLLAGTTVLTTLAVQMLVTKGGFSFQKFQPDFSRFQPFTKIQQIAGQGPSALLQAVIMLAVFSTAIYVIAMQNAEIFLAAVRKFADWTSQGGGISQGAAMEGGRSVSGVRTGGSRPPAAQIHQGPADEQAGSA